MYNIPAYAQTAMYEPLKEHMDVEWRLPIDSALIKISTKPAGLTRGVRGKATFHYGKQKRFNEEKNLNSQHNCAMYVTNSGIMIDFAVKTVFLHNINRRRA